MKKRGITASLKAMGQSDEEIQETAILSCAQPNSTGQSKMNTLAFVKAILDFANEPQSGGIFETTKAYPLLIDARVEVFQTRRMINKDGNNRTGEDVIVTTY